MPPSSTENSSRKRKKRDSEEGITMPTVTSTPRLFKKSKTAASNTAEMFKPATPSRLHASIAADTISHDTKKRKFTSKKTNSSKSSTIPPAALMSDKEGKPKTTLAKHIKQKPVTKRPRIPGKVRKLGLPRTRPSSTLNDNKITANGNPIHGSYHGTGTFTSSSSILSKRQNHQLWITRKTDYSVYLKSGISAFISKNAKTLELHALGAAIPMCLSLALAIADALPCGQEGIETKIITGSEPVVDEIVPEEEDDEDAEIIYQTRVKSTIHVHLSLKSPLPQ